MPRPDLQVVGSTGLLTWNGVVDEEYQRELYGPRGRQTFKEMRDGDPVVGAILFAIDMLCRGVEWGVNPATDKPDDQDVADFVESCMHDMSVSWEDFISEVLSMLPFGWSYFETLHKIRGGQTNDPTTRSRYDDGKIGWRKFAIRSQDTLSRWKFDSDGGVQAMMQMAPPSYQEVEIPIQKSLLFRTTANKGNPEGRSVLRNAYRPWYFKKHIENIEGIGIERDLAGLPVVYVPSEVMTRAQSGNDAEAAALLATLRELATSIRRDEREGIVFPRDFDERGHPLYDLQLLSSGGSRQFDTDKIVSRYDQRIAMVVLADFILLGHEQVGSFALSSDKTDLFAVALGAWLKAIKGVLNAHAVPRLLELNGIDLEHLPEIDHGDIDEISPTALAAILQQLSAAGMPVFPDTELERYIRDRMGLPAPVEEDQAAAPPQTQPQQPVPSQPNPAQPSPGVPPAAPPPGQPPAAPTGQPGGTRGQQATEPLPFPLTAQVTPADLDAVRQFHHPGGHPHNQKAHAGGLDVTTHNFDIKSGVLSAKLQTDPDVPGSWFPVDKTMVPNGSPVEFLKGDAIDASVVANVSPSGMKGPELDAVLLHANAKGYWIKNATLKEKKIAVQYMKGYNTFDGQKTGQKLKLSPVATTSHASLGSTGPAPGGAPHTPQPMGSTTHSGGKVTWSPPAGFATEHTGSLDAMKHHSDEWKLKLTLEEKSALASYTGSGYDHINASLKNGSVPSACKHLDSALNKGALPEDRILYRGTKIKKDDLKIGATVTYHGYNSASTHESIAKGFVKFNVKHDEAPAFYRVKAPKGTKCGFVNGWSTCSHESEVLLPRSTKFKITGMFQHSNGVWDLEMDVVE